MFASVVSIHLSVPCETSRIQSLSNRHYEAKKSTSVFSQLSRNRRQKRNRNTQKRGLFTPFLMFFRLSEFEVSERPGRVFASIELRSALVQLPTLLNLPFLIRPESKVVRETRVIVFRDLTNTPIVVLFSSPVISGIRPSVKSPSRIFRIDRSKESLVSSRYFEGVGDEFIRSLVSPYFSGRSSV